MKNYLKSEKIIGKIEKIRSKNNVNWMDILSLAFKHDPKNAAKIVKKFIQMIKKYHHL